MKPGKLLSLGEAADLIDSGSSVAVGGSILGDHPMALLREITRRAVRDLTIYTILGGLDVDLLCGSGCVRRVEAAYVGLGPFGLAPNFRRCVQNGEVDVVDFSEVSMLARFRAAAFGLPMMIVKTIVGTDIMRQSQYARPIRCPFTGEELAAVKAISPDFTLIHVAECDEDGNMRKPENAANPNTDEWFCAASGRIIVTCERLLSREAIRRQPGRTWIAGKNVTAVVPAPGGCQPGSCNGEYGVRRRDIEEYLQCSTDEASFRKYLAGAVSP